MGKFAFFALTLLISTQALAQIGDRYEFHARATELSNHVWRVHGIAVDTQQNRAWWCVYYVNVRTIGTRLECLRRSVPSTEIDPSRSGGVWIPASRGNTDPPKVAWSIEPDTGIVEACILVTKMTCKAVRLGSFPKLLEAEPAPPIYR